MGCGAGTQAGGAASETALSTVTPTPTATVMSDAEAGKFYLAAVCPTNILSNTLVATAQAEPLDVAAVTQGAASLRDGYRKAIEILSDEKVLWPESVKADVATLAESMYADLAAAGRVANQTTEANLSAAWNAWGDADRPATAQKIRLKLSLPSDTKSSCEPS
jgi:hypothetical protein